MTAHAACGRRVDRTDQAFRRICGADTTECPELQRAAASVLRNCRLDNTGRSRNTVSIDPTRELYADFNAAFARHWKGEIPR